jgi:putative ATP-dependent endonuclease of OLD family
MHRLAKITIRNFRSCISAEFVLEDYTPLVGYNNAGKSNVLAAIKWLLRPSSLSDTDFCDRQQPVVVTGEIQGIDEELLRRIRVNHRTRIEPYCAGGRLWIRRVQTTPGGGARAVALQVRNPNVEDEDGEDGWDVNPTGIEQAIQSLYPDPIEISAMEDAAEDVAKFKTSSTIGKLIGEVMRPVSEAHATAVGEVLNSLRQKFEVGGVDRAPELDRFDALANRRLAPLFPGVSVKLHIPTPELKELFKSGTIRVFEDGFPIDRDITSMGHGAQRSVQMALIKCLADMKRDAHDTSSRTLLLIDEPELYLHPQAVEQVRTALKDLSQDGYQVVFTTHSAVMVAKEDIPNALLLRKCSTFGTRARVRLSDAVRSVIADAPSQARVLFSLGNASQILFSDRVLLVEGEAEQELLPDVFEKIAGRSLGFHRTALVPQGGAGSTRKSLQILDAMDIPALALVDLDYACKGAIRDGFLEGDDPDVIDCRAHFQRLQPHHGFALAEDGFPRRSSVMRPERAFEILADDPAGTRSIGRLHEKLKAQRIWLWTLGAIERHLGIERKEPAAWVSFRARLRAESYRDVVHDHEGLESFVAWATAA